MCRLQLIVVVIVIIVAIVVRECRGRGDMEAHAYLRVVLVHAARQSNQDVPSKACRRVLNHA